MLNNERLYPGCLLKAQLSLLTWSVGNHYYSVIIKPGELFLVLDIKENNGRLMSVFRLLTSNGTLVTWSTNMKTLPFKRVLP